MFTQFLIHLAGKNPDPFVSQLILKSEKTDILTIFWQIQLEECGWRVRVVTPNYTLHPNRFPLPIEKHKEYNVSFIKDYTACVGGEEKVYEMNVTLSIILNENVLKNAPYIVCLISRQGIDGVSQNHRSKEVYLQSYMSAVTTTVENQSPQSTSSITIVTVMSKTLTSGAKWHTVGLQFLGKVLCPCTFLLLYTLYN